MWYDLFMETPSPLPSPEDTLRTVDRMYMFDVDGPIVEPGTETVTHPEILTGIIDELRAGRPVALITGRGTEWLTKDESSGYKDHNQQAGVVSQLEAQVGDGERALLDNLFVSAEFGGDTLTFENGKKVEHQNEEISLPSTLVDTVGQLISDRYSQTMMNEPKKSMITAKVASETSLASSGKTFADFKREQGELAGEIDRILKITGQDDRLEVHQDRIATNVRDRRLNKVFATKEVLKWMREKGFDPQSFVVFADSKGDFEIADALVDDPDIQARNLGVKVLFVGNEDQVTDIRSKNPKYEVEVRDNADLTQGTADFMREQSA